ncbi:cell division protein FtsQ/DivIB [Salinicoccus carnicancri]|uniref:cell division protein FtsQ/DivIB n=1 Tax=Salinicoccus carnicancri TaxID=558170 RepID=UPI0002E9D5E5|nr:FtsQ-type POTRA domain-containing protein [Salinicoccus carnicancri]
MEERPDINDLKKRLKDDRTEGKDEHEDMLRARLEGEPNEDAAAPGEEPGAPAEMEKAGNDNPTAAAETETASQYEQEEAEEGSDEIETFTRDGKPISVDTYNRTDDEKEKHRTGQKARRFEKTAAKEKVKKERKPLKSYFRKPKRVHVYTGLIILALMMFGVLVWYVFSDASSVKEVSISGNSLINDEEIAERLQFSEGDKMFSINTDRAEENIALLPAIEEVHVARSWWNGVDVNISEYRPLGYVTNDTNYYPVLENARVLRGYPAPPNEAPILHYFEGEEFDALVESLGKIDPSILGGISEIYYRPSEQSSTRIHMFMNDGQEIVADYRTIDSKMNYYIGMREEIGDSKEGVIDLEIGSSFLPYDSAEAEDIKQGIYETPVQAQYIENVSGSLGNVKEVLSGFGDGDE